MFTLFVGLGPNGKDVSKDDLRRRLEEQAPILDVRHHGQSAFIDVESADDAEKLIRELNGQLFGECRLAVQHARRRNEAGGAAGAATRAPETPVSLFVGLGPQADTVTDEELKRVLEEGGGTVKAVRRRGSCCFVDTEHQFAERMIRDVHGRFIGAVRLTVQWSDESDPRGRRNDSRGGGRGGDRVGRRGGRDDDRGFRPNAGRRGRDRDDSRDRSRRGRSRSRDRSRSRRDRSRDKHRRRDDSRDRR